MEESSDLLAPVGILKIGATVAQYIYVICNDISTKDTCI